MDVHTFPFVWVTYPGGGRLTPVVTAGLALQDKVSVLERLRRPALRSLPLPVAMLPILTSTWRCHSIFILALLAGEGGQESIFGYLLPFGPQPVTGKSVTPSPQNESTSPQPHGGGSLSPGLGPVFLLVLAPISSHHVGGTSGEGTLEHLLALNTALRWLPVSIPSSRLTSSCAHLALPLSPSSSGAWAPIARPAWPQAPNLRTQFLLHFPRLAHLFRSGVSLQCHSLERLSLMASSQGALTSPWILSHTVLGQFDLHTYLFICLTMIPSSRGEALDSYFIHFIIHSACLFHSLPYTQVPKTVPSTEQAIGI